MRKIEWGTIGFIVLWAIFIIVARISDTHAQDIAPSVCRDPELTGRFEFHNLPDGWSDGTVVWWSLYEGGSFEDGVLMADAYTDNEDVNLIGTATVGSADYSFELRGDAQTPTCAPETAQMPIVGTNNTISSVSTAHTMATVQTMQTVSTGRVCTIQYPKIILVCG